MDLPTTTLRRQLEAAYRALDTLGREREKWRKEVIALDAAAKSAELQRDALLRDLEDASKSPIGFRRPYGAAVEPLAKALARASAFEAQCDSISDQFVGAMKMLAGIEAERNALLEHLKDKPEIIAAAEVERDAVWTSLSCLPNLGMQGSDPPARPESAHREHLTAVVAGIMQLVEVQGEPRVLSRLLAQSISSVGTVELERVNLVKQLGEAEAEREVTTERLGQANAERDAITNELAKLQAQLEASEQQRRAVVEELNAVYRSHSWRVTRPLRKIVGLLLQRS
jgi:chromosome segregation ATPase